MSKRLFLLAHISQENDMSELKEKYKDIRLSLFEEYYLDELIKYNIEQFNEWNEEEQHFIELLYKKMKHQFQVKYNYEYNTHSLIWQFEKYITKNSSLYSVIDDVDYA